MFPEKCEFFTKMLCSLRNVHLFTKMLCSLRNVNSFTKMLCSQRNVHLFTKMCSQRNVNFAQNVCNLLEISIFYKYFACPEKFTLFVFSVKFIFSNNISLSPRNEHLFTNIFFPRKSVFTCKLRTPKYHIYSQIFSIL